MHVVIICDGLDNGSMCVKMNDLAPIIYTVAILFLHVNKRKYVHLRLTFARIRNFIFFMHKLIHKKNSLSEIDYECYIDT